MAVDGRAYTHDDIRKLRADRLALNDALLRLEPIIAQAARSLGFFQDSHNHEGMEAEDAMQAGRIGAWLGIFKFDPDRAGKNQSLEAFLYTMARQEMLDEIRRCRWMPNRRRSGPSRVVRWNDFDCFAPLEDKTLEQADGQRELDKIERLVSTMNTNHRNVYQAVLRHDPCGVDKYGEGERYARMVGLCGPRISQIKSQIRHNIRKAVH